MANLEPGSRAIITTQTDPLNLRAQPSTSATVLGLMPRGSRVRIDGPPDGAFYPVTSEALGRSGFAGAAYLTAGPADVVAQNAPPPPEVLRDVPILSATVVDVTTDDGSSSKKTLIVAVVGLAACILGALALHKKTPSLVAPAKTARA